MASRTRNLGIMAAGDTPGTTVPWYNKKVLGLAWKWWIAILIAIVVLALGLWFFLRKKKPKASSFSAPTAQSLLGSRTRAPAAPVVMPQAQPAPIIFPPTQDMSPRVVPASSADVAYQVSQALDKREMMDKLNDLTSRLDEALYTLQMQPRGFSYPPGTPPMVGG